VAVFHDSATDCTTVTLGFTLTSLNNFFLKVFEGYILLEHFPFFKKSELRQEKILRNKLLRVQKIIDRLEKQHKRRTELAKKYTAIQHDLQTQYERRFPGRRSEIMPTPFGNILKAAEHYPGLRYKIDSVPMWPRIIHVIPQSYNNRIEETHNQLSFLVNCSVLAGVLGLQGFIAAIYQTLSALLSARGISEILYFIPINVSLYSTYTQRVWLYLAFAFIALIFMYIFYRAALLSVTEFGDMIRSVYDLFRFDLLKQLHFAYPNNTKEEVDLWESICHFMNIGHSQGHFELLEYSPESSKEIPS